MSRPAKPAVDAYLELTRAGYDITYVRRVRLNDTAPAQPDIIMVRQHSRTITTLVVRDGAVCADSVQYLLSEAFDDGLAVRHG